MTTTHDQISSADPFAAGKPPGSRITPTVDRRRTSLRGVTLLPIARIAKLSGVRIEE